MSVPTWATHLATDEDGELTAFDRHPVFLGPDAAGCGVWALPSSREGRIRTVVKAPVGNARLYPPSIARLLCVAILRPTPAEESA